MNIHESKRFARTDVSNDFWGFTPQGKLMGPYRRELNVQISFAFYVQQSARRSVEGNADDPMGARGNLGKNCTIPYISNGCPELQREILAAHGRHRPT